VRKLAFMLLLLSSSLHAAPLDVHAKPEVQELELKGVKGLHGRFYVRAPAALVLHTLWDVTRFKSIFPDIKTLDVVARQSDVAIDVAFTIDAVLTTTHYTLHRVLDVEHQRISWQRIAGDVRFIEGSWTVSATSEPDVVAVDYESFVEVGGFVPTSIVRSIARGKVDAMADRVRAACSKP
jgi:ribosome-associated toxin RatA of RatAB toxin-antitoxin module